MNDKNRQKLEQISEQSIITEIKTCYNKCKEFFTTYTNEGYEIYTKEKKEFLKALCTDFYVKFNEVDIFPNVDIENIIKKSFFIPIVFKNGGFEYPRSFTIYMDRIKDINIIPAKLPNIDELEEYILTFKESLGLEKFFEGFFVKLRRINIYLRKREIEVLKILANPEFLRIRKDNSLRIFPPSDFEIIHEIIFV